MELVRFLQDQWAVISSAPVAFLGTIALVWIIAWRFTRSRLSDEAAALRERNNHLMDRISELQAQETALLEKLQGHGEDIAAIKDDLSKRPQIHVGPEEPKGAKDGDLWFK